MECNQNIQQVAGRATAYCGLSAPTLCQNYLLQKLNIVRYNVPNLLKSEVKMQRLKIDQDIRSLSEVRTGIANFIKQVHDTKRPVIITQHGKGVAVLLDASEYEAMQDKLELLTDVQMSINQLENGQGVTHEDAKATILKRVKK